MASVHFVSVSHFGNSHSISNFSLLLYLLLVVCDQWSLIQKDYDLLKAQMMSIYHALKRLQYSVNITFIQAGKPKNLCDLFYCGIRFTAVVWNRIHNISEVRLCVDFCPLFSPPRKVWRQCRIIWRSEMRAGCFLSFKAWSLLPSGKIITITHGPITPQNPTKWKPHKTFNLQNTQVLCLSYIKFIIRSLMCFRL